MFKMIKYEFRKHITSIIILLIVYTMQAINGRGNL